MKNNLKKVCIIIGIVLWLLSLFAVYKVMHDKYTKTNDLLNHNLEYVDSLKTYNKYYDDSKFSDLKNINKELYDSLKQYKNQIDYLTQFTYEKENTSGKVVIIKQDNKDTIYSAPKDFVYESEPNDTFTYKLTINSEKEPNYYKLDTKFKEKFTLVNKTDDSGNNHLAIGSETKGDVSNVTVYKKKQSMKLVSRFAIGPAVTVGYDPFNKRVAAVCGVSLTFKLN